MLSSLYSCPATALAKSLLDVWLSGDRRRLHLELENVERISLNSLPADRMPFDRHDEWERLELLKSIAGRMRESEDLFEPRARNPRLGTWFDLLHHMSGQSSLVN